MSDELVMTEIECQVVLLAARVFRTMSQSFQAKGDQAMADECLRNAHTLEWLGRRAEAAASRAAEAERQEPDARPEAER